MTDLDLHKKRVLSKGLRIVADDHHAISPRLVLVVTYLRTFSHVDKLWVRHVRGNL